MNRKSHWEEVFETRDDTQVSWHQPDPSLSLRLIEAAELGRGARIIDVGGGTSTLVDHLLERGYRHVGVLDVSAAAIGKAQARLGDRAAAVEWFIEDVIDFQSPHPWDLWHDRALFHFLTEPAEQLAYKNLLQSSLAEGGQVVIATFGPEGPLKCSGLDVCRYDSATLQKRLGDGMELMEEVLVDHTTPSGATQQFLYCRFRYS